jgi:Cu-processing system ATP-binding protein
MISLSGLRKRYGALDALRDVSLELRPGAVTALVGPNGSGKTTIIKIVLGLARPDTGSVRLNGLPGDARGDYRRHIGYMPQAARFPDNLSVRDVLDLVGALRPDEPRDEELVTALGLDAELDRPVASLSGGTRQKLNAAIAFLFRPAVLVLDEPTAGLDPIAAGVLKDKIRRARAAGRTVLVTSHVLAELEELADDVAFLCDGCLRFSGSVAELLASTGAGRIETAVAGLLAAERAARRAGERVPAAREPAIAPTPETA